LWMYAIGFRPRLLFVLSGIVLTLNTYPAVLEFHMQNLAGLVIFLLAGAAAPLAHHSCTGVKISEVEALLHVRKKPRKIQDNHRQPQNSQQIFAYRAHDGSITKRSRSVSTAPRLKFTAQATSPEKATVVRS